jgi:hypothetical protein
MRRQLDEVAVGQSPAGKNASTEAEGIVGIHHQATPREDTEDWEDLRASYSELQSVN